MLQKRMVRLVSLLLVVFMATVLLYGCGGSGDQGTAESKAPQGTADSGGKPAAKPPIEVSMMLQGNAPTPDQFVITKIIKDKFNIDMKWMINPSSGFFDKLNVMIASNELPDMIAPLPIDQAKGVGVKGGLVPFNKYLDKMPNVKKMFDADPITYTSSMASDGNVYAVPTLGKKVEFRYVPTIRADLLAEVNMKAPETFEELYGVLKAIKAKHPESLGIVNKEKGDALNDFGKNFNTRTEMFLDETQDKFVYGPLNDGYKEMITFFKKLWDEKLLDSEFFTASQKQWEEKLLSGNAVFWLSWPEYAYSYEKLYKNLHPDSKFDSVPIMPLTSNIYNKKVVQGMPQVNTWTTIAISSKAKNVDRILELVDWMYSEEGSTALQFGIENENYKMVDGMKKFVDSIKASYNDKGTIEQNTLGIGTSSNLLIRVIRDDEFLFVPDYQKDVKAVEDQYRKSNFYNLANKGISLTFTEQQLDEMHIGTDLKTFVSENSVKFIVGQKPMSEYDAFKAELQKRGAEKIEKIYADAYLKFKDTMSKVK